MAVTLRVVFEQPGFFLGDSGLVVTLDGKLLHDGGFKQGFDVSTSVEAGSHELVTVIRLGPVERTRRYALHVEKPVIARLRYSRLWGNFTSKLELG